MGWQTEVAVQLQAGNTIINPNGTFVYSSAPASGNLIFSAAPVAGTDQFGNKYVQGAAAYETIGGITYAIQLGESSFAGTPVPGVFIHVIGGTTAAVSDPNFSGIGESTGSTAVIFSGQSLAGSTGSGIQASDSTFSGVPNGTVNIVAGQLTFEGVTVFDGTTLTVPVVTTTGNITAGGNLGVDGGTLFVGTGSTANIQLNPAMAIPPNHPTAGKTLAQTQAFIDGMFSEMEGRGFFT
jgi:hypothetical protein